MIYKAVIFDAGGVLHPDMGTDISADVRKELDLTPTQAVEFWDMVIGLLGLGQISEAEFWIEVSKKLGTRVVKPEENLLGRVYEKHLSIRRPLLDLAAELSAHGIKTAVLSNTIESHAKAQAAAGQFTPFDARFLSNEMHLRKPGPKMFEVALNQLGVAADETIFIDDKEINLEAPRELGMRGILYESEDRLIAELRALCLPVVTKGLWVAFTILERADGALLLQHRDNKPTIASPGGITGWGGAGKPGESPLEGAYRELQEETSVHPKPGDLEFLSYYKKTMAVHGKETDTWAFKYGPVDDKTLKVFEGQGFVVLKSLKQADALPLSVLLRQVIAELWAGVKSRHE